MTRAVGSRLGQLEESTRGQWQPPDIPQLRRLLDVAVPLQLVEEYDGVGLTLLWHRAAKHKGWSAGKGESVDR
jgi:hypothetical protein